MLNQKTLFVIEDSDADAFNDSPSLLLGIKNQDNWQDFVYQTISLSTLICLNYTVDFSENSTYY